MCDIYSHVAVYAHNWLKNCVSRQTAKWWFIAWTSFTHALIILIISFAPQLAPIIKELLKSDHLQIAFRKHTQIFYMRPAHSCSLHFYELCILLQIYNYMNIFINLFIQLFNVKCTEQNMNLTLTHSLFLFALNPRSGRCLDVTGSVNKVVYRSREFCVSLFAHEPWQFLVSVENGSHIC